MQKSKRCSLAASRWQTDKNESRVGGAGEVSGKKEINKTSLVCNIYYKQRKVVWGRENCQQRSVAVGAGVSRGEEDGSRVGWDQGSDPDCGSH